MHVIDQKFCTLLPFLGQNLLLIENLFEVSLFKGVQNYRKTNEKQMDQNRVSICLRISYQKVSKTAVQQIEAFENFPKPLLFESVKAIRIKLISQTIAT